MLFLTGNENFLDAVVKCWAYGHNNGYIDKKHAFDGIGSYIQTYNRRFC